MRSAINHAPKYAKYPHGEPKINRKAMPKGRHKRPKPIAFAWRRTMPAIVDDAFGGARLARGTFPHTGAGDGTHDASAPSGAVSRTLVMDWKQFVASLIGSLTWPAAVAFIVYLLREPLRKRIHALRRFRHRDTEFEFADYVEEAEAAAQHAELPFPELTQGEPALSTELQAEIATAPRAAVIEAWLAVERELETLADQSGVDLAERRWTSEGVVSELRRRGVIDRAMAAVIGDLRDARNVAAHVRPYTVEHDEVVDYVKLAGRVRSALRLAKEAHSAAGKGRTAYDLLVYHDLSDPTERTGGTIPSVEDNAEEWFGDIGRHRNIVAVGPGIHESRVAVVLAHRHGPMPEMQALLDREPNP